MLLVLHDNLQVSSSTADHADPRWTTFRQSPESPASSASAYRGGHGRRRHRHQRHLWEKRSRCDFVDEEY